MDNAPSNEVRLVQIAIDSNNCVHGLDKNGCVWVFDDDESDWFEISMKKRVEEEEV